MRIGIDARFYGPRMTGIGIYAQELIKNLLKIDKENQYVVFLRKKDYDNFPIEQKNVEKVTAEIPHYSFQEQLFLSSYLKKQNLDLVHFVNFNRPIYYRKPYTVMIHDLTLFYYPPVKNPIIKKMFSLVMNSTVKNASRIIVPSQWGKKDLINFLKVPEEKIEVVYEGFSSGFDPEKDQNKIREIKNKYRIKKDYLLYMGQQQPHKNLERLVEALDILIKKQSVQLVIAGKPNRNFHKPEEKVKKLGLEKEVIFTGFVPEDDVAALYSGARAFVFPSLYEGFGIPPLEAMSCSVPVVSSSASCMPEILGDAAHYFDPKNPKNIAQAVLDVLSDSQIRQSLIKKGLKQIKKYNWHQTAQGTLDIFNRFKKS